MAKAACPAKPASALPAHLLLIYMPAIMDEASRDGMDGTVSVILPTYNERDNIAEVLRQVGKYTPRLKEIVVVDDDSPDGTWRIVRRAAAKNRKVRLIRRLNEKGLASAIARGVGEARGDVVVWMDCDLCHSPDIIPRLVNSINGHSIAVASRYAPGGKDARRFTRVATTRALSLLARLVLGISVKDVTSGYIAARRSVFSEVELMERGYGQYFMKLIYDAERLGFGIKEVGFVFRDRETGVSKSDESIRKFLKLGISYVAEIFRIRLGGNGR